MAEDIHKQSQWSKRLSDWETAESGPAPLPGDWERLVEAMDEKPRRKIAAWWWAGGLIILLAGLTLLLPGRPADITLITPLSEPVLNDVIIESSSSEVTETAEVEPVAPTAISENRIGLSGPEGTPVFLRRITQQPLMSMPSLNVPYITTSTWASEQIMVPNSLTAISNDNAEPGNDEYLEDEKIVQSLEQLSTTLVPLLIPDITIPFPLRELRPVSLFVKEENAKQNLRLTAGPQLGIHRPEININLPANTLISQSLTNSTAYSHGLRMQVRIGDHWGVQAGFSLGVENSLHRFATAQRFSYDQEIVAPNGDGISKYEVEYATAYSRGAAEVELLRPRNITISTNRFVRLQVQLEEEVKTLSIPLLLTYDMFSGSKFSMRFGAGVAWNQQAVTADVKSRLATLVDLQIQRSGILEQELLLNDQYWTGQLTAGLIYSPFDKWELILSPVWSTNISNLAADPELKVDYNRFSFSMGINYRINN